MVDSSLVCKKIINADISLITVHYKYQCIIDTGEIIHCQSIDNLCISQSIYISTYFG